MTRRRLVIVAAALVAALSLAGTTEAVIEHQRGNIVSVDWDRLTLDIRHPNGDVVTWKFSRNASVKFIDGAPFFRNPSTRDLRQPMYVAFTFENQVIQSFEVRELGFVPGNEESASEVKRQGVPRTVIGTLTAWDENVMQIELEIRGARETFQCVGGVPMKGFAPGQRVQLRTEWSGQQELVHEVKILKK